MSVRRSKVPHCIGPDRELLLNSIIKSLLWERRLPPGSILDAGAFDGQWACYYANIAAAAAAGTIDNASRTVYAVDPDEANVIKMRQFEGLPNLQAMVGLLGNTSTMLTLKDFGGRRDAANGRAVRIANRSSAHLSSLQLPVYALDDLFGSGGLWQGDTLALAHLDVEGFELSVLQGAGVVVRRDRPVLVTEVTVQARLDSAKELLRHVHSLGYQSYLIEEIAGLRADIRNVIHFPQERVRAFLGTSALDIATTARALQAVTAETIGQHAFPCCARGAACCELGKDKRVHDCCSHYKVHQWMRGAVRSGGADLQWFTRHTWYDSHWLSWRPSDEMLLLQQQVVARGTKNAGFSYYSKPNRSLLPSFGWSQGINTSDSAASSRLGHSLEQEP